MVVKNLARKSLQNGWPLISVLALLVFWLSGRRHATLPFFCCIIRASFTTICILTSLQRPRRAFKTPTKYAFETALHLALAGLVAKFLVARGPNTAQSPSFITSLHYLVSSLAFATAGIPPVSVPFPETVNMQCWLLAIFASTLIGVVLPLLRWHLCNVTDDNVESEHISNARYNNAHWDVAQIVFVGCCTVSAIWMTAAQVAAFIE